MILYFDSKRSVYEQLKVEGASLFEYHVLSYSCKFFLGNLFFPVLLLGKLVVKSFKNPQTLRIALNVKLVTSPSPLK